MGQKYLIDTNAAIDYFNNKLPINAYSFIDGIIPQISVISRIEMLAWPNASKQYTRQLQSFIAASIVYGLEEEIIIKAIDIRKSYRVKLPDAIIGATVLVHGLVLITNDISDFDKIKDLQAINPHQL